MDYWTETDLVYFMQIGLPRGARPIKVGATSDLRRRLAGVQHASPFDVRVLGVIRHPAYDLAEAEEQEIHARFARHRLRGEWFRPVSRLLAYIEVHAVSPDTAREPLPLLVTPPHEITRLVDASDVARHIRVSETLIRKWARSGQIPCVRIGAQIRFDLPSVLAHLKRQAR